MPSLSENSLRLAVTYGWSNKYHPFESWSRQYEIPPNTHVPVFINRCFVKFTLISFARIICHKRRSLRRKCKQPRQLNTKYSTWYLHWQLNQHNLLDFSAFVHRVINATKMASCRRWAVQITPPWRQFVVNISKVSSPAFLDQFRIHPVLLHLDILSKS